MADLNAKELDEWRLRTAESAVVDKQIALREEGWSGYRGPLEREQHIFAEYRRLVVEDVRPPAEPDQDTLDTRAVLAVWMSRTKMDASPDEMTYSRHAIAEIKERAGREAIMALPDEVTVKLARAAATEAAIRLDANVEPEGVDWLAAIKQVYGESE